MSMLEKNLVSIDGVVDVGLIVVSHFENPIKPYALNFLRKVLRFEIRAIIPTTAFIGAYHILTNYLKAPRKTVGDLLKKTLSIKSKAIYEDVSRDAAIEAIDYAVIYRVESWDGYLIALAKKFGASIFYTLDNKLEKVEEITVINPIPWSEMEKYHEFIRKLNR